MWKRRNQILLLAAVLLAGGLIWAAAASRRHEPCFQGRPLHRWLQVHGSTSSDSEKQEAAAAIRHMGTNAIPYLIARVQYEPGWIAAKTESLLKRLGIAHTLFKTRNDRAWDAVGGIGELSWEYGPTISNSLRDVYANTNLDTLTWIRLRDIQHQLQLADMVMANTPEFREAFFRHARSTQETNTPPQ